MKKIEKIGKNIFGFVTAFTLFTAGAVSIYAGDLSFQVLDARQYLPAYSDTYTAVLEEKEKATTTPPEIYRVEDGEKLSVVRMIVDEAEAADVNPRKALYMARHESRMNPEADGDTKITCPHSGEPFLSRGLFQISKCYYADFSNSDAYNPLKNTRKAMEIINGGKAHCRVQFTTCDWWYDKSSNYRENYGE